MPHVEKLHYTVGDVCKIMSMSKTTFFALVKSGKLRTVKRGRRTLVTHRDLMAFATELDQTTGSCPPRAAA